MRQSMGEISTLNIIIIFIIIVFGLLSATLSYYKAYKLNTRILDIVQKYEGYNKLSKEAITEYLDSFGYAKNPGNNFCAPTLGTGDNALTLVGTGEGNHKARNSHLGNGDSNVPSHYYCLYYVYNDSNRGSKSNNEPLYYNYVVFTYIFVDLPIAGQFKIPVRTKGERVYNFSDGKNPLVN